MRKKNLFIIAIVVVLLCGGAFYKTTYGSIKYEGYKRVKKAIESNVKNPDTIKFPSYFSKGDKLNISNMGDKAYRYDGYFSAKNDMGVDKRVYFEFVLIYDGKDYIVEKNNISER